MIGSGSMDPELLRAQIRKLKAAWSGPFAVNMPLLYKHMPENLEVVLEEDVPIVISSAGSPSAVARQLQENARTHVHVVAAVRQAQKCQDAGVDAVVCEGYEAGGHLARQGTTTICLVPQVVDAVDIPVIAAGGIADGRGMAAAFALGAEGVQVGTRFAASQESSSHHDYRAAVLAAGDRDTVVAFQSIVPVRLITNKLSKRALAAEAGGASDEELRALLGRGRGRLGIFEGNLDEGELEAGQIAGLINDCPSAAEIITRLMEEYEQSRGRMP